MFLLPLLVFVVVAPDGWVEDRALAAEHVPSGFVAQAFRSPDGHAMFVAARRAEDATLSPSVVAKLASTFGTPRRSASRGRTIDDVRVTLADGDALHVRVTHGRVGQTFDATFAFCRGRGQAMSICEEQLEWLNVQVNPDVDYDSWFKWLAILGGILVGAGVVGVLAHRWLRERKLTRSAPLVEGEVVTVSGKVRASGSTIEAPLSGRACVLHRSRARVVTSAGELVAEPSEAHSTSFVIDTQHGPITIEDREPQLACPPSRVVDDGASRLRAFRDRNALDAKHSALFDEIVIAPGSTVTVRGVVAVKRDDASVAERGYRDDVPATTCLVATPKHRLEILDVWE